MRIKSLYFIFFYMRIKVDQMTYRTLLVMGHSKGPVIFYIFFFQFFYRSSSALHRRSSTEILPDHWGTFCAGVCPKSVFSFLVAAGFEPTSLSLGSGRINRYTILTPQFVYGGGGGAKNSRGGKLIFTPTKRGAGGGKSFSNAKGGHKTF